MNNCFFRDLLIGDNFIFGTDKYMKIDKDKGLSLSGMRLFNLMEVVSRN